MDGPDGLWWLIPAGAGLVALAGAFLVATAAPHNRINQRLAFVLSAEAALAFWVTVLAAVPFAPNGLAERLTVLPISLQVLGYVLFLGALDTPLAKPLATRTATTIAAGLAFVAVAAVVADGPRQIADVLIMLWLVIPVWGLLIALSLYVRAGVGEGGRRRAGWFAAAFGIRDAGWLLVLLSHVIPVVLGRQPVNGGVWPFLPSIMLMAYVPCLVYGMVRHQVLDFDARVRRAMQRGTVASAFVVVYLVASELAQLLVSPALGPAAGILAAAALGLSLVPLQGAAERFAARMVPGTADPGAARRAAYRTALADAMADPSPEAHRDALARMRQRWGIDAREHELLVYAQRGTWLADEAQNGLLFGRFRVLRQVGEGSGGRALLADDERLDRLVVIKRVDGHDLDQVMNEARSMARVRHPNVLTIHDVRAWAGAAFLILEHVEGETLKERLARGAMSRDEWDRVAHSLLAALAAVHDAGLVHGDVKPGNVLLAANGVVRLCDFGLARDAGRDQTRSLHPAAAIEGTLRFLAPERIRGAPPTPASDLYAAAVTLFEGWTGHPYRDVRPRPHGDPAGSLVARDPSSSGGATGVAGLDAWFEKALDAAPEKRFDSARAMREALGSGSIRGGLLPTKHEQTSAHADDVARAEPT